MTSTETPNRPAAEPQDSSLPLASVVIPNWNGAQHLPVCLDALRAQTYPRVEVLLVDNGSTDGSQALVENLYPEVQLLALDRNLGLTGGNNTGFRAARTSSSRRTGALCGASCNSSGVVAASSAIFRRISA